MLLGLVFLFKNPNLFSGINLAYLVQLRITNDMHNTPILVKNELENRRKKQKNSKSLLTKKIILPILGE